MTDHRIGLTLHKIDRVMLGELDELVDALTAEDAGGAARGGRGGVRRRRRRAPSAAAVRDPAGTVGAFLCRAGQHLRAAAYRGPRLEARLLLAHAMGCRHRGPAARAARRVPPDAALRFAALLRRRLEREPVAHLLGARGVLVAALRASRPRR